MARVVNILKINELRYRIIYTLCMLAIYRFGVFITIPGVNKTVLKKYLNMMSESEGGFFSFLNFFSGGAFENASIFALGIMPYISSSIIMSLLVISIPFMEKINQEGSDGAKKIYRYTKYGTILISIVQSIILGNYLIVQMHNGERIVNESWLNNGNSLFFILSTMIVLSGGTACILWLGSQITKYGIGNGISLIIFAGIIVKVPTGLYHLFLGLFNQVYKIEEILFLFIFVFIVFYFIVFVEKGERRIKLNYMQSINEKSEEVNKMMHIPFKINSSGVIPPIFASTILMFPSTIASLLNLSWLSKIQNICNPTTLQYNLFFILLIIFFSYFYTRIQLNSKKIAENLEKSGGYIPGYRPGNATINYLNYVINRITLGGSIYLSIICVFPMIINKIGIISIPFLLGGTSLLIIISVSLDLLQQIEGFVIKEKYTLFYKKQDLSKNNK